MSFEDAKAVVCDLGISTSIFVIIARADGSHVMQAMLIIVFLIPGHTVNTQAVPMQTMLGCHEAAKINDQPANAQTDRIAIPGLVISSFCVDTK